MSRHGYSYRWRTMTFDTSTVRAGRVVGPVDSMRTENLYSFPYV